MTVRLTVELQDNALDALDELGDRVVDLSPVMLTSSMKMTAEVKQHVPEPKTTAPQRAASTDRRDKYRDMRRYRKAGVVSSGRPADGNRPILVRTGGLRDRIEHYYGKDYAGAAAKGPHSHLHANGTTNPRGANPKRDFLYITDRLTDQISDDVADFIVEGKDAAKK